MPSNLSPSIKLVVLLVFVSSFMTLVRIRAQNKSTIGAATSAASFPRFDRVLLLEDTSETSANVSIGDRASIPGHSEDSTPMKSACARRGIVPQCSFLVSDCPPANGSPASSSPDVQLNGKSIKKIRLRFVDFGYERFPSGTSTPHLGRTSGSDTL